MCGEPKIRKHKAYLSYFLREFAFFDEAKRALEEAFDRLFADQDAACLFEEIRTRYEGMPDANPSFLIEASDRMAEKCAINPFTVYLLVWILLSESCQKVYADRQVSAEMWRSNMLDLRYWCNHCFLVKGVYGTAWPEWPRRFFNATRFTFGKLQFETDRFGKEWEKDGIRLKPDDQVIFIHIPRTGERLLPEDVDVSCAAASTFFKQKYGIKQVFFACHSWLLYPENRKMLSEKSNLYSFMSRFDIVDVQEDTEYKEIWRLFDKEYNGNADELPQDTSLRRAYAQRMRKHQPLGVALGIWIYRG